jgi:hypothetical protein
MTETTSAAPPTGPKDFSRRRDAKTFVIDGDTFEATSALPGEVFVQFTEHFAEFEESDSWRNNFDALAAALELVLLPESYKLLRSRLADLTNPVDMEQMADIVLWLMDEYGLRPTQPPSDSSDGSPDPESGTSSTENTPPEEPTSAPSEPIAS